MVNRRRFGLVVILLLVAARAQAGNRAERVEWFMDQGLGMFVHWSVDSQLGSVISHSMVGASDDYLDRFVNELPTTFYPERFNPDEWARLAKLAGMKYVVFTTKHHSGFCMFHTKTTDFNIRNTPYKKDITKALVKSLRKFGIAVGMDDTVGGIEPVGCAVEDAGQHLPFFCCQVCMPAFLLFQRSRPTAVA